MSKKIYKIAVIGCGGISRPHMEGVVENPRAELYAVCDPATDGRLEAKKEKYGAKIAVGDYKELLNDDNIDIVIVATPDYSHMEITCAFLRAGKDVLLEKPMALQVDECEEMLRVQKETGKRLMVGQVGRYNGNYPVAKNLFDQGIIGELAFIECEYGHDYSVARGFEDWRVNPEREGMIGGGCHAVDAMRWIAGNPTEVHAFSNHKFLTDWPVDDTTIAIYKFPNGAVGKIFCSIGIKSKYSSRLAIYGTKGSLICDARTPNVTMYLEHGGRHSCRKPITVPTTPSSHNCAAELTDFIKAIDNNEPTPISPIEGASTVAVCRATVESAKSGETVKIKYPEI